MTPEQALEQVLHCFDRAHIADFKTRAYQRALEVVRVLPSGEVERRAGAGTLTELDGIGTSIARLLAEVVATGHSPVLAEIDATTQLTVSPAAQEYRTALRGDCHLHTRWSDGGATVAQMVTTARAIGHEYLVITDHSARLTVAHGLDRTRLLDQLAEVEQVRADLIEQGAAFRVLTGMEVDIFEDGSLDLDDDLLARLDVVVASVHSKLRQDAEGMTRRMVAAARNPHVDILGHCTGRMIDGDLNPKRPPSLFDPQAVFGACAEFDTAVEINSRPERLDPPDDLLALALAAGCMFTIDSDAHATGQLEWQPFGCEIAARTGVPRERILNTWAADDLLAWCGVGDRADRA